MKTVKHGMELALSEHLLAGNSLTRLEGLLLFGVSDLTRCISRLRHEGWVIKSHKVPYAKAVRRINEYAIFKPPKNLPIKELQLTEYWVSE